MGSCFFGVRNRTFIRRISAYGGSPLASSMAVLPTLHMSTGVLVAGMPLYSPHVLPLLIVIPFYKPVIPFY